MNIEQWPNHPLTGSNKHGKSAIDKQVSDLVKLTQAWNSYQVAHFGAIKLYATGTEHGKVKHGMELLKELNKSPLVTLSQKGSEKHLQACEHGKNIIRSQTK